MSDSSAPSPLRPATPDDLEVLVPLVRDFYAHFDYPYVEAEKREVLARILGNPSVGRIFLIERDARAVGYVFLSFYVSIEYGGLTAFVDELYVRPEHRGAGLGTATVLRGVEMARELGLRAVHLETERTNTRATALYVRLGFVDHDRKLLTRSLVEGDAIPG